MAVVERQLGSGAVYVTGLKEFRYALRAAEADLPKELRAGMRVIAKEILEPEVRAFVKNRLGSDTIYPRNRRRGRLLRTVIGSADNKGGVPGGQVKEGTAKTVPYGGWWEFGGSTKSPIWGKGQRPFREPGRAMYPALVRKRKEIWTAMDELLTRLSIAIDRASESGGA